MSGTAPYKITFSGDDTYTLTTSYVASDAVPTRLTNMAGVYVKYTPAANNSIVTFKIQMNPYDAETDAAGAYWSTYGYYVDGTGQQTTNASGSWVTQDAVFNSLGTSTSGKTYTLVPVPLDVYQAMQIRILAKETTAGDAGNVTFTLAKNDYC